MGCSTVISTKHYHCLSCCACTHVECHLDDQRGAPLLQIEANPGSACTCPSHAVTCGGWHCCRAHCQIRCMLWRLLHPYMCSMLGMGHKAPLAMCLACLKHTQALACGVRSSPMAELPAQTHTTPQLCAADVFHCIRGMFRSVENDCCCSQHRLQLLQCVATCWSIDEAASMLNRPYTHADQCLDSLHIHYTGMRCVACWCMTMDGPALRPAHQLQCQHMCMCSAGHWHGVSFQGPLWGGFRSAMSRHARVVMHLETISAE